ncbi:Hypothetical predicted protein [Mytilus galloprovincialis]|uniref:TIR domain-containing protein n=1 Tax=Mytilus galloprovincialis TaxID=29158 RepID=A0A8B6CHC9_MYTGA|nr:Hypothetical predicted protein [Mytilus galloprovincialis]
MAFHNTGTMSALFLTCPDTKDMDWTREFVHSLRQDGFNNIYSTTDLKLGVIYFEEIKDIIKKVHKILIVISKTSSRTLRYLHTIDCIITHLCDEGRMSTCGVIPLLIEKDVKVPFVLECFHSFNHQTDPISKIKKSLSVITEGQAAFEYSKAVINLSLHESQLRRLNKLALSANTTDRIKELANDAMQQWGIAINDKCLTVDMNTLQNISAYHRLCLRDLFNHFHADDGIRIIRATGVIKFSFQALFENGQVYNDLIAIYRGIFTVLTKDKRYRYWYRYRRNGLIAADGSELAYKPINDGIALFNDGKPHSSEFNTYESRLHSLKNFPIQSQIVRELIAECGFFSLNSLDFIQCFHCGICLRTWNINSTQHSFYFENCALRKKKLEVSERIRSKEIRDQLMGVSFDSIFARMFTYKLFPNFNEYNEQLMKFAQAGFYYLGTQEDTLCYSCCLGLTKIKEYQNPWEVHYMFSPNCKHLKELDEDTIKQFEERRQTCYNSSEFVQYLEIELMLHK